MSHSKYYVNLGAKPGKICHFFDPPPPAGYMHQAGVPWSKNRVLHFENSAIFSTKKVPR